VGVPGIGIGTPGALVAILRLMLSIVEVPEGYQLRAASIEDAPAIAELINESILVEIGAPWTNVEETRDELNAPGRDTEHDDALVIASDGTPSGYLQLWADIAPYTRLEALVYVRPPLWGRGLNTFLLRLGEERAKDKFHLAPPGEQIVLQVARFAHNEPARRLFESLDYEYARTFWMMRIELEDRPPPPEAPTGIRIRAFEPGRDERALHAAFSEAFADHWGQPFPSFEQWSHFELEGEGSGFDPSLWFLAFDGDEVVGAACCRPSTARGSASAQVNDLAVRRPWRRRGVGLALLHTAFGELHRRRIPRVELGVDSENATGATRLYERAGMHVAYAWEFWEKALRA